MAFSSDDESDDGEEIDKEIQKYKSLILLKNDLEKLNVYNKDKIRYILNKLIEEWNDGYGNEEEYIRSENCTSLLHWMLGETEKAFEYCDKVLQRDNENLIALANKAYFLFNTSEINKSRGVLKTLGKLKSTERFGRLETNATAEIAYSYSRFGPRFQVRAIEYFREALRRCPSNDLWKFGLGLTLRRQAHVVTTAELTKENIKAKATEAAKLYFEVCTNNNGESSIRAKAYCELGNLLDSFDDFNNDDTEMMYFREKMKPIECFQEALSLRPDDVFVLEKCGKQFRYFSKRPQYRSNSSRWLFKSKELLEKSLGIRETLFAYHHLGLTLEAIAKDEINNVKSKKKNLEPSFATPQNASSDPNFERRGKVDNESMDSLLESLNDLSLDGCHSSFERYPELSRDSGYYSTNQASYTFDYYGDPNAPVRASSRGQRHYRNTQYHHNSRASVYCPPHVPQETPWYHQPVRFVHPQRNNNRDFRWRRGNRFNNKSHHWRQNTPVSRGFHRTNNNHRPREARSTKGNALKICVKSPKKLRTSPNNPLFLEAIEQINKAITLQKGLFATGYYDIGILYRELEENENAILSFNKITKEGEVRQHASHITIINAYEQQGIIKLENAGKETDARKRDELIYDGKKLLRTAVKLSAKNIMKFSLLRCAWEAFPTLTDLLQSEGKRNCKELAKLHELVGLHCGAIDFYKEVYQSEDSSEKTKTQALRSIVENYVKENDFDNAEVFLDCLRCTGEANKIPQKLYYDTYLRGAMHAASKNDRGNMKSRFNSAYKVCVPNTHEHNNMHDETGECDCHDALLLKAHGDVDDSNLRGILTDMCGLSVTVDTENCPYGSNELNYITAMLKQCYCIFCILQSNMTDRKRKYFMDLAVTTSGKVFIVKSSNCNVPDEFGGLPALHYPELDQAAEWIEIFLHCMSS